MVALLAMALVTAVPTVASAQWVDGSPSRTQHRCVIGTLIDTFEDLSWTWVGFEGLPQVGTPYYMRIIVGGLGCGGVVAAPEVLLPRGTTMAVDGTHPVRCFFTRPSAPGTRIPLTDGSCPTAPHAGNQGAGYLAFTPTTQPFWPLAPGTTVYIEFPVVSTMMLSGIATNDYLRGAVYLGDLNSGSFLWDTGANEGVFVTSGASSSPRIIYPEPSTSEITTNSAVSRVHVYTFGCAGNMGFEILPADPAVPDTSTILPQQPGDCAQVLTDGGYECRFRWATLTPNTLYRWRITGFTPNPGGPASCSTFDLDPGYRYFTTLPSSPPATFPLVVTSEPGGTAELTPAGGAYAPGTSVTVTATAQMGYHFAGWRVDDAAVAGPNPLVVTVDAPHTVVARFAVDPGFDAGPPGTDSSVPGSDAAPHPDGADGGSTAPPRSGCSGCTVGDSRRPRWAGLLLVLLVVTRRTRSVRTRKS